MRWFEVTWIIASTRAGQCVLGLDVKGCPCFLDLGPYSGVPCFFRLKFPAEIRTAEKVRSRTPNQKIKWSQDKCITNSRIFLGRSKRRRQDLGFWGLQSSGIWAHFRSLKLPIRQWPPHLSDCGHRPSGQPAAHLWSWSVLEASAG